MGSRLRFALCAPLLFCSIWAGAARASNCSDHVDTSAAVWSDGFAFNLSNTRVNASQITSSNVATLQLALSHAAVGSNEKRGAPAVTQQAVFFSAGRDIVAMNRKSGCTYWRYTIPNRVEDPMLASSNAVRSAAIYYLNEGGSKPALVFAGDQNGVLYALNAQSGALVWSEFLGTDRKLHFITGGLQFYGGRLYVPIASKEVITTAIDLARPCCTTHGMVRAVDAYTGTIDWTYDTADAASYQRADGTMAPNGMSVWSTPAIDPARNALYIGTGQNLSPPTTDNSDAVIALNLDSGTPKWVYQATYGDAWNASCELPAHLDKHCFPPQGSDFDFGASPILVHLAGGRDALIAGAKNGVVYSLNPDTGALNWSQRVGAGGNLGGIHWGMAADATQVYVGVSDVMVNKLSKLRITDLLNPSKAVTKFMQQVDGAHPGVYALNLLSGDIVWQVHPQHAVASGRLHTTQVDSIYSAALSVTNDVVFAGSLDGELKALRSSDGKQLWSYQTAQSFVDVDGHAGNGGSIDSIGAVPAGTDLYVNSGYDTFGGINDFQAGPGNALFVFRLPPAN